MKKVLLILFLVLFAGAAVSYAAPISLISESTTLAGQTRTNTGNTFALAIDGQTAYLEFMKGYVTKVQNINGTQTSSVLITPTAWSTASGGATTLTAFYGFGVSGSNLIWTDTSTDAVWKADKSTGAISQIVSKSSIEAYLGVPLTDNLGSFTVAPDGGLTFFESHTQKILHTNLSGNLSTVYSAGYSITSGLTYDLDGRVYWTNNTSHNVYRLNTDSTVDNILTTAAITAVTGSASTLNDMFYADGKVYIYDQTTNGILQFDVSNPADLSYLQTTTGRANTFALYKNGGQDYLAYHNYTGDVMEIAIPEPATIGLLTLGGLFLRRARKH